MSDQAAGGHRRTFKVVGLVIATAWVWDAQAGSALADGSRYPSNCPSYAAGSLQNSWGPNCWLGVSSNYIYKAAYVQGTQFILKATGDYGGSIDGIYGSGTAAGVRSFQNKFSPPSDAVVGTQTWIGLRARLRYAGYSTNFFRYDLIGDPGRFQEGDYIGSDGRYGPWGYTKGNIQSVAFGTNAPA